MSSHELATLLLVLATVAAAALVLGRSGRRLGLPLPLVFLVLGFALGLAWSAGREAASPARVVPLGTVALILILLDGGLAAGWSAFRRELGPILGLGLGGTAVTFGIVAVAAHAVAPFDWQESLVVGAVLAPTDPAAVFSVLGSRLRGTRIVTILEGEAGVNDPVAIALTLGLLDASRAGGGISVGHVLGRLAIEFAVGAAVGLIAAIVLMRLLGPSWPTIEVAPALTVLAAAFAVYGGATLLHGSGFLAVYLFGLVMGTAPDLPERGRVVALNQELATLAELGMFVLLGDEISRISLRGELGHALVLSLVLIALARPLVVYPVLRAFRLSARESAFGAYAGLKGAVPVLLGSLPLADGTPGAKEMFALIAVVVVISLLAQGLPLPRVARLLAIGAAESPESVPGTDSATGAS